MPYYTMLDKVTGIETDMSMTMAEREQFLEDNPHMEQKITVPRIGDSVLLGVTKNSGQFKELVGRIKERHHRSTIDL